MTLDDEQVYSSYVSLGGMYRMPPAYIRRNR